MRKKIAYKKEDQSINFAAIDQEAEKVAIDVNHILRVNGNSAFPMPKPKLKNGLIGNIVTKLKNSTST